MSSALCDHTVLICDDEILPVLVLQHALRRHEMRIVGPVSSGQAAINLALVEKPDFVLLDYQLPDIDGIEAAHRILSEYKPCIFLVTGYVDEALEQRIRETGIYGVIEKPFNTNELPVQLSEALCNVPHSQGCTV